MNDDIPTSIAESEVEFDDIKIKVHVLSDGRRVIERSDMERLFAALTDTKAGAAMIAAFREDDDTEICETCDKRLHPGDLVHRCEDGPVLCEECAPTYNDIRRQYDEAKADGSFEHMFPFPEDAPENDAALDAIIAAGDGDKKNVSPL